MTFEDDRGGITGIVNQGEWREFNMISSRMGVRRGGHYHKNTNELFFILSGEIEVFCVKVSEDGLPVGSGEKFIVGKGRIFVIEPFVYHTFATLSDASWINVLSNPHDKNNPDMCQLDL
jgi:dTDP-4-dehydrorhamnose 3,5-epimerase-like enzyme